MSVPFFFFVHAYLTLSGVPSPLRSRLSRFHDDLNMIAMTGTSDRLCWLAENCQILLLLLLLYLSSSFCVSGICRSPHHQGCLPYSSTAYSLAAHSLSTHSSPVHAPCRVPASTAEWHSCANNLPSSLIPPPALQLCVFISLSHTSSVQLHVAFR